MLAALIQLVAQQAGAGESTRLIDWGTVVAQVANFLVLVLLLRHFLYGRIIRAMDQREKKIVSHFESAEQKEKEAAEQAEAVRGERDELRQKSDAMLVEARDDADKHRRELMDQARGDADRQVSRWRDDLRRQRDSFLQQMRRRAAEQVCAIARRALSDLADAELEGRMVDVLVRRLGELADDDRRVMAKSLADSGEPLVVATAWEVAQEDRRKVTRAARKHIAEDAEVRFETAPGLVCGIELRAGGRKISWTIDSYIQGLGEQLAEAIDEKIEAGAARPTPPGPGAGEAPADSPGPPEPTERERGDE